MRKFLLILVSLIVIVVVTCTVIYFRHPVISKWMHETARNIGKPIDATVYLNGRVNDSVKVYRDVKFKNDYIVSFAEFPDLSNNFKYLDIDLEAKSISKPASVAHEDYDVVMGRLFMSDIAEHVTDVRKGRGFTFDPSLVFTKNEIRFHLPTGALKMDSVKIVLNDMINR